MSGQNMYQLQKPVSMRYKNVELRIIRRLCYTEWKKFYNAMCNTKTPNKYRTREGDAGRDFVLTYRQFAP